LDFNRAYSEQRRLAFASDSAALAAALAADNKIAKAETSFLANYSDASVTPQVVIDGGKVRVTAARSVDTTLLKLAGIYELPVEASSTATIGSVAQTPTCVLLLEDSEIGLTANSDAKMQATCGIHVNSSNAEAIFANSNSTVVASSVCVKGQAHKNSGGTIQPAAKEGCTKQSDPLVSLPEPAAATMPCNFTDFTVNGGFQSMSPGVYCGKTEVNALGSAKMQLGVYVFRGEFVVNSLSSVEGNGVMLFFQGSAARLNVNSASRFQASAPTTGTHKGILIYQSRDPRTLSAPPFIINSNSLSKYEGAIYAPNRILEVNSLSTFAGNASAAYTVIIARKMTLNSFGEFKVSSDYEGTTPLHPDLRQLTHPTIARLTQ